MVGWYCFDMEVFMRKLTPSFPVTGWIKHCVFRLLTPAGRHTITLRGSQKPQLSTSARARSETTRHLYVVGFAHAPRFLCSQFPSDKTINGGHPCAHTRMQRDRLRTLKILCRSEISLNYYRSLLYSVILLSRANSLRSLVILHEWIAFHSAFFVLFLFVF